MKNKVIICVTVQEVVHLLKQEYIMKKTVFKAAIDLLVIAIGGALFALAIALLLDPYGIVPGGVTGISILLCEVFPVLPLGMTILVINIPLFLLSWRLLGRKFLIYSAFGTLTSALMIELFEAVLPPVDTEPLLAGVFGGLLMGAGIGLVFLKGATTGGTDIIARLLKLPLPNIQIGRLILAVDGCIAIAAGFVFGSVNHILYAAITLFISSRAIDGLLYGMNIERLAFIISEKTPDIISAISGPLGRGATLLHGEGSYKGEERKVIMCAIKRQQIAALKNLVKQTDPKAFLILTEANEVLGEGFAGYEQNL